MLPYSRQSISDTDIEAVVDALRGDWLTQGPMVARYETSLAEACGAHGCVAVSSGTAALHLAYASLGLGPGDEVITTPITFSATANAACLQGATPVFADVEPDTGNLDLDSVASKITDRTVGIAAVHYGGLPVDLAGIADLARTRGLWVVEDACHALGASYDGAPIGDGRFSDATVLSTHAIKNITTGEGGAVLSRRADVLERCALLRSHGIDKRAGDPDAPWSYDMLALGWNYRITDLQCALGLSQLARLDAWIERRRELAGLYAHHLARRLGDAVRPQAGRAGRRNAHHLMSTRIDFDGLDRTRADVMRGLRSEGIATQVHYIPVPTLHYYRERFGDQPRAGADRFYRQQLSLPLFADMREDDVIHVVSALERQLVGDAHGS
ncbi:MAG: UDP-4-amino-4,6-dideoxy-N-acetyl-beta-L-altrosamine transaminase [Nannocystaceae bacterium]|nr:UDP-4-amino-4,6-dideoxy-N-acetyl-beta-L-altrosamine transaminase [bacterium]